MKRKNRGSAIITALFIMTLVAIAATAISFRLQIEINRAQAIINSDKLRLASQAVTFAAMAKIYDAIPLKSNQALAVRLPLQLPADLFSDKIITVSGQVEDLQGRFNINNLSNQNQNNIFMQLLKKTNPKMKKAQAKAITLASIEWLKRQKPGQVNQSLENYYTAQKPPYFMAHQLMVSVSEWRLVKGVTQSIFNNTKNFLTTLPTYTKLNINNTPQLLLEAQGLPKKIAQKIISAREKQPLNASNIKTLVPEVQKVSKLLNEMGYTSEFFLISAKAASAKLSMLSYTVVQTARQKKSKQVKIIRQSVNSM